MSDKNAENMTKVVGYFNPHPHPVYIEISEVNLKATISPKLYIRDRQGRYINDPILEPWCHPKGLARTTTDNPVPIVFLPRFVKSERPAAAVTQATGFVRQPDGRTVPSFAPPKAAPREVAVNKTPHVGMTIAAARKMGLVGKPRLLSEDYGADETTGAPPDANRIPSMKYSLESPPKIKGSASLRPELTEADVDLPPEEKARRVSLQQSLAQASSAVPAENFDPARLRPLQPVAPIPLKAPDEPTQYVKPAPALKPKSKTKPPEPPPKTPKRRVATPISETPEPAHEIAPPAVQPARIKPIEPAEPAKIEPVLEPEPEPGAEIVEDQDEPGSGVVEPLDESTTESPVLQNPPPDEATGKRFVCAADGKPFTHRSELERHVKRHYQDMYDELMSPYPP